jgi:hypothetical protein
MFIFFMRYNFAVALGMFILQGRILRNVAFGSKSVIPSLLFDFIVEIVLAIDAWKHVIDNFIIVGRVTQLGLSMISPSSLQEY